MTTKQRGRPARDPATVEEEVKLSTRLPAKLHARATRLGKEVLPGGKSLNQLIVEALAKHVAALEAEHGIDPDA